MPKRPGARCEIFIGRDVPRTAAGALGTLPILSAIRGDRDRASAGLHRALLRPAWRGPSVSGFVDGLFRLLVVLGFGVGCFLLGRSRGHDGEFEKHREVVAPARAEAA